MVSLYGGKSSFSLNYVVSHYNHFLKIYLFYIISTDYRVSMPDVGCSPQIICELRQILPLFMEEQLRLNSYLGLTHIRDYRIVNEIFDEVRTMANKCLHAQLGG